MREYSNRLALLVNDRGVYSLDPSIGCRSGMRDNPKGCYSECYAAKSAKLYGYDFSKTVFRDFENEAHAKSIVRDIMRTPMPFIRMGTSGDPSEDWAHTLRIVRQVALSGKEIVIITKHWTKLTDEQLREVALHPVCINTSVSAMDAEYLRARGVEQFRRLKPFCKSVLRIVSCDFNRDNEAGLELARIQDELFKESPTIDTVFRVSRGNAMAKQGVIMARPSKFLGKNTLVSKFNRKTYFGKCATCKEMCGVNV